MVSDWFTTFDDVHATPAWSAISGDSVPFQCHFSCARRFLTRCPRMGARRPSRVARSGRCRVRRHIRPAWVPGDHPELRGPESQARAPSDRASAWRSAGTGSRAQIGRSVAFPATGGGQTKDSDEEYPTYRSVFSWNRSTYCVPSCMNPVGRVATSDSRA
jgi:hypothetical protein